MGGFRLRSGVLIHTVRTTVPRTQRVGSRWPKLDDAGLGNWLGTTWGVRLQEGNRRAQGDGESVLGTRAEAER